MHQTPQHPTARSAFEMGSRASAIRSEEHRIAGRPVGITLQRPTADASGRRGSAPTTICLLERGDTATVRHVLEQMSPQDRLERFHAPTPRIPAGYLRYLADVDGVERGAVVCREGEAPVGLGWFFRLSASAAEIAVAITTAACGRQWGTRAFEAAMTSARAAGYVEAAVFVRRANHRMREVLERRGFHIHHLDDQLLATRPLSE